MPDLHDAPPKLRLAVQTEGPEAPASAADRQTPSGKNQPARTALPSFPAARPGGRRYAPGVWEMVRLAGPGGKKNRLEIDFATAKALEPLMREQEKAAAVRRFTGQ